MGRTVKVGALAVVLGFLVATNPVVVNAAGQITSGQIKNNTVKSKDVKDGNLQGKDVKDGSVTGADIDEASLAVVPSATTATSAANATNATNLGGLPAVTYLDRAVYSAPSGLTGVPLAAGTLTELRAPVSLTIPAGVGFVRVSGGASYQSAAITDAVVWYAVDALCTASTGFGYDHRAQGVSSDINAGYVGLDAMQPLTGTHTFRLCGYTGTASNAYNAQLLVETVATNGTGGLLRPAPDSGGGGRPTLR